MTPARVRRTPDAPFTVLRFWFDEAGPRRWFRSDATFDAEIDARFSGFHEAAVDGLLEPWAATAPGALALILLLDQFSRNIHRGDARAYAADDAARRIADAAIARRFDRAAKREAQAFFYLPFMHSEAREDQARSVALFKALLPASSNYRFALGHRRIVERFGRFPHRNAILGRTSTEAEIAFLRDGRFGG